MAQQGSTADGGDTATTDSIAQSSSACDLPQTGVGASDRNLTGTNSASGTVGRTNTTSSEVQLHIQEACIAAKDGDMQGVLMYLNLALKALGVDGSTQDNIASTTGGSTDATTSQEATVHGRAATGPYDDYDEMPDADDA
ncbi:MAG: hypothetical protein M3247_00010 [Thermoproteota archaeon]|jgi:hypothetical protein|nr:hypothetical protein [Thermoproteota archaeon]